MFHHSTKMKSKVEQVTSQKMFHRGKKKKKERIINIKNKPGE